MQGALNEAVLVDVLFQGCIADKAYQRVVAHSALRSNSTATSR